MTTQPLLEVRGLVKQFEVGSAWLGRRRRFVRAVDGVSFTVERGSIFSHRGLTHSLAFALVLALIVVSLAFRERKAFTRRWWLLVLYFFVVTASDHAGFRSRAIAGYSVHYAFSGFFRPLDNPPALNAVRGGSTVPVKFGLAGDQGLQILAAGSPSSAQIDCDTGSRLADAEPAAGTLGYDVTAGTYTYEWKTSAAWTDTCRQLDVALVDGTVHSTLFRFR